MAEDKLFILHQGALGDVVLTFPAILALRKHFDRIDILCQGQIGKLAAKLGLVDKGYPLEAAYFASLFSNQINAKIKDLISSYTRILVLSFSSDLENAINQISDRPCLRIAPRPPAQASIHVAEYLIENIIKGGLIDTVDSQDVVTSWHRERTPKSGPLIDSTKIIIHPGAGSKRKRWPLERFFKLAQVLEKKGFQPQFVCGPAEPDLIGDIRNENRAVHHFSELTDLADWFKAAGGYIGNDSGVSHLAVFLGLPSVVIFGPADPKRWIPIGPRVQIVRPESDCQPCFELEPDNCTQPACLTDATLESVLSAFDQVFKG
jgi:ADP-heptose:LPS heptosyltransferase